MTNLKVPTITDSLGPRHSPVFDDTLPHMLRVKFLVHQVSIGGATATYFFNQLAYYKMFAPDIIAIQAGIVDCAPRVFKQFANYRSESLLTFVL
jgi:hypothetical protein